MYIQRTPDLSIDNTESGQDKKKNIYIFICVRMAFAKRSPAALQRLERSYQEGRRSTLFIILATARSSPSAIRMLRVPPLRAAILYRNL